MFDFLKKKKRLGQHLDIFLDVDGVLNQEADWQRPFTLNRKCVKAFQAMLRDLEERYDDVSVILSSSWRSGWEADRQPAHIQELCNLVPIKDVTPMAAGGIAIRGKEIRHYLKQHPQQGDAIIFDDDARLFTIEDCKELPIVFTNGKTGFTKESARHAIGLLERKHLRGR